MKINAALQLLPLDHSGDKYEIIDKAIALIKESKLNYRVCPFETVVEGESEEVYALIQKLQLSALKNGCGELLLNIKIHAANKDLSFDDKLRKYPDHRIFKGE